MGQTCGIDWAEDHHDMAVVDESGNVLAERRIGVGTAGFAKLVGVLAECGECAQELIPVAIESSSLLVVAALLASGRTVYASIHSPFLVIAIDTGPAEPNRMPAMPSSWPTFFGPTRMRIGPSHLIAMQ